MVMSSHAAAENDKMVVAKLPWKAQHNWQFFGQIFCQDRKRNIECQKYLQWYGSASSVFTLHRVDDIERRKESEIAADGWELTKYLNFLKARALLENKKQIKIKSCKIVHILIYWTLLCACAYRIIDYPKHGGSIVGTWVNNEHEETGNIELELLFKLIIMSPFLCVKHAYFFHIFGPLSSKSASIIQIKIIITASHMLL